MRSRHSVRVLVDGPSELEFSYSVPDALVPRVQVGSRVRIPLRNRKATGTVLEIETLPEEGTFKLKDITDLIDDHPVLTKKLVELGRWISSYYRAPMESVMRSLLPEAVRSDVTAFKEINVVSLAREVGVEELEVLEQKAPRQAEVIERLQESKEPVPMSKLAAASVRALEKKGIVTVALQEVGRDPNEGIEFIGSGPLVLNPEQEVAMASVLAALANPSEAPPLLLYGVTGSGKTEIYLQAIQAALDSGKTALVLVPEISLTPQTVDRFKARFASMQSEIAVFHSHLSVGERHDEWHKIHRRQARVVIGARSAIFAPLENLGIIVVDEEHETTYKQENPPRYQARDIAVVRGKMEGAVVLLGSATPGLESYHNALSGKYTLLRLDQRADNCNLPLIRVVDMRLEGKRRQKGMPGIFSEKLRIAVDKRLEASEQIIFFLNRRGFATSFVCQGCGFVAKCNHCASSLTFHQSEEKLVCHICGFRKLMPRKCPECGDPSVRLQGYGTERVTEAVGQVFPKARVARVDADSMQRKNQLRETLAAFKAGKLDILVGTQMIAKGLHFPNVTLVGVLNADLGLHMPDFRSGERTFQLLTQVAGRAGRGEMKGEVFVQTFTPHHPAVQFARHHNFDGFAEQELEMRRLCGFPPFSHCVLITVRSTNERMAEFTLETLHKRLQKDLPPNILLGNPAPSPLVKAADQYRFQLMMRAKSAPTVTRYLNTIMEKMTFPEEVFVVIDVDPMYMG
jgi:primosomal protein N' (replication factor Y) (superfamily II helicase)